jgi:hypothetical protein
MQVMTNSFPSGAHLHRMGLRRSNECTLCQGVWRQREDNEHDGAYHLRFRVKTVSDTGHEYVTETHQLAEVQHIAVTEVLQKLFKNT